MGQIYEMRAHHIDLAFSMAETLRQRDRNNVELSDDLETFLLNPDKVVFDNLKDDDWFFLGLLGRYSVLMRESYYEKFSRLNASTTSGEDKEYIKDSLGDDRDLLDKRIDRLVEADFKSILAVYLDTTLRLGDILDEHCTSCAIGSHCMNLMRDDRYILFQLNAFRRQESLRSPKNAYEFHGESDLEMEFPSVLVRAFLFDRLDSEAFEAMSNPKMKNGVIRLSQWARVLLMTKKRGKN